MFLKILGGIWSVPLGCGLGSSNSTNLWQNWKETSHAFGEEKHFRPVLHRKPHFTLRNNPME